MNRLSLSISFLRAMRDEIDDNSVNPIQRVWDESGHEAPSPIATVLRLGALDGRESYDALVDFLMTPDESNRDENFRILLRYALPISLMIPEFTQVIRCLQITPHHKYDVYDHTIDCVLKSQRDPVVRLAAFFHDIGKPCVQEYRMSDDGSWRHTFIGHAAKSAEITRTVLERLDALLHRLVCAIGVLTHYSSSSTTVVPTLSPLMARMKTPGCLMSNTMMGILLSWQSAVAVASMTLRSRLRTSR